MSTILILRPEPEADLTALSLRNLGHKTLISPILVIKQLQPQGSPWPDAQAFIVTSRRAAFALPADQRPVYAIGEATANACGNRPVFSVTGNWHKLSDLICSQKLMLPGGLFMHLCGDTVKGHWEAKLQKAGYHYRKEIVYKAIYKESIPSHVQKSILSGSVSTVLLYSPLQARHFFRLLKLSSLTYFLRNTVFCCISIDVAREIPISIIKRVKIADAPNEQSLFDSIDRL